MKKFQVILLLFISVACMSQNKFDSFLKKCTSLTYHINYNAIEYDFILDSLKISNDISFSWKMTEPMTASGKVFITKFALDTATVMNCFFADSSNDTLTSATTVWVSKKIYKTMKKGGSLFIDAGLGREKLSFKSKEKLTSKVNGKNNSFDVFYCASASGNKFWILDDPSNPLILKMYLGWTIEIKEIITTK
jgi:hypothetical protein